MSSNDIIKEDDLVKRTLRMVAILVGACALFVGLLSLVAVLVTSKATSSPKDSPPAAQNEAPAKKPLSI
jgi:hypothetical protein